jgi:protein-S-isoprenylcysteine O-methyltransferase Ste14
MIEYAIDVIIIIISLAIFGYIHSFLASNKIKRIITVKFGDFIAFYRFFYNVLTLVMLYFFYLYLPQPDTIIYDLPTPYDYIILIPQFLSLAGIIWCFKYFSFNEFLGIAQIRRWFNGKYNLKELDEHLTLRIEGPYKFSRHPVYLFSILFLFFRPVMDERFGKEYIDYQKRVPRIFPAKFA